MAEESKVNKTNTALQPVSESIGENGLSLPAVPVTQLAKFHTKAKKGEGVSDPHDEASKTFKLTTQRKAVEPFKPSTAQLKQMDGFAIGPYRPEPMQKKVNRDMPVVQQMSATGVVQKMEKKMGGQK